MKGFPPVIQKTLLVERTGTPPQPIPLSAFLCLPKFRFGLRPRFRKVPSRMLYTAIDFETTGTWSGFPAEPWQIGCVRFRDGKTTDEQFDSLIHIEPGRPFNPHAPGRHAQLRDELAAAPTLPSLWPTVRDWCAGVPLIAHNVATERKILTATAPMHRFGPWIDTLKLVRIAYPKLPSHALSKVLADLRLEARVADLCPDRSAHDALYDAVACAILLEHLLTLPGWEDLTAQQLADAAPKAFYQK